MIRSYTPMLSKSLVILLLLSVAFLQPSRAQNLSENAVENDNFSQIMSALKKDQQATKIWWNSWLGLYSAATVVQTGIALQTDNKALRQDMYLGAATTLLGAGAQLFTPMVKIDNPFFTNADNLNEADQQLLMSTAQDLLEKSVAFEKAGRSWQNHAKCTVVNLGGGLITWLAFDRTLKDGIINFAINSLVTEAQIWSQPIIAKKAYKKYFSLIEAGVYTPTEKTPLTLSASAIPSGFQLKIIF